MATSKEHLKNNTPQTDFQFQTNLITERFHVVIELNALTRMVLQMWRLAFMALGSIGGGHQIKDSYQQ